MFLLKITVKKTVCDQSPPWMLNLALICFGVCANEGILRSIAKKKNFPIDRKQVCHNTSVEEGVRYRYI